METSADVVTEKTDDGLSKRAKKKLLKRQTWLDSRAERKAIQKAKRKEKVDKAKAAGIFDVTYSQRRKRLKQSTMETSSCKMKVVLDMQFSEKMNDRNLGKCFKQLLRCYSINRRLSNPMQLHVCSLTGKSKEVMDQRHDGYTNWDCNFHEASFVDTFVSEKFNMKKEDIVYLTSDSNNSLGENLDSNKAYVIGGLVDHNKLKGICHQVALDAGVSHARLPIDEYINMKTRKVLTIDHVFQILAKVGSDGISWKEAFMSVIPERKGAQELDDSDEESENSEATEKQNVESENSEANDKLETENLQ